MLAEAAEEQPLLCGIDDAQWLDSASARALAFVARRLVAEKIALVFATRELGDTLSGLPELPVTPLERTDARALLESVLPAMLDESVLERIVAETRGNPLALLELPRGLSPTQLAGGFGLPATAPLSAGIEGGYTRRLARLPPDARRLLLVAATDPVGDPALVWRAAERLGIPESAAHTVESEQWLTLSPRVVFRHPLVRSAVYGAAGLDERREVHRALARSDRSWHRPGSPRLAPRAGHGHARRAGCRRTRTFRRASAGAWRPCRGRGLSRARGRAHARAFAPCATRARRCTGEVPGRRSRRRPRASGDRRVRRLWRRSSARPCAPASRPDRVRGEAR